MAYNANVPAPPAVTTATGDIGGFTLMRGQPKYRLVVSIEATEKCGKTHFALTAPGPHAYANYDTGLEGVVEKFTTAGKKVYKKDYRLSMPPGTVDPVAIAGFAHTLWEQYKADMRAAWKSPLIRTTVCDAESETWELIRLARFGKLTQVMPHHYGPVNSEYRNFYNEVYDSDKNLVLIRRMKDEWENDASGKGRKTGKLEAVGMKDVPYMVQINLRARHEPFAEAGSQFSLEVINCRQNMALAGTILPEPMCNFPTVAQLVYPNSKESDWL